MLPRSLNEIGFCSLARHEDGRKKTFAASRLLNLMCLVQQTLHQACSNCVRNKNVRPAEPSRVAAKGKTCFGTREMRHSAGKRVHC